ncbi:CDP-diacylglycerol--glycerol-3-phosphate 3-phosphatidyltransferase [bacterium]|nr:CDP-diacylglycerol--glycerol-3-phosphate 3-phosphatidyltransferase [bacterium]
MTSAFFTLPNMITISRIFLAPIIVVLLISPFGVNTLVTAAVFLFAAATDWLDGRLARRYNQVTTLGTLLDPVADKLLVMAALVALASMQKVPALVVVALVGRDLVVSGIRQMAAARGTVIAAGNLGKYKTALEMAAIVLLMVSIEHQFVDPALVVGIRPSLLMLLGALILAIVSGASYLSVLLKIARAPELSD